MAGKVRPLKWTDVEGWAEDGGAVLGTRRTVPDVDDFYSWVEPLKTPELGNFADHRRVQRIQSRLRYGQRRDRYPAFRIPIVCVPATIDNNMPGCELSIGVDTALNNNADIIDRIKQSASASRRCFVVETMGRKSGYLALMSAIATGAEQVYLYETGISGTAGNRYRRG